LEIGEVGVARVVVVWVFVTILKAEGVLAALIIVTVVVIDIIFIALIGIILIVLVKYILIIPTLTA